MTYAVTCHTCGQEIPNAGRLSPRELELVAAYWLTDSVKEAGVRVGITEQRAKNMMATARIRNRAPNNWSLVLQNMGEVRAKVAEWTSQNIRGEEVG